MRHSSSLARTRAVAAALLAASLAAGVAAAPAAGGVTGYEVIVARASAGYRYQVVTEGAGTGFEVPGFDDTAFSDGAGVFGTAWGCAVDDLLQTPWQLQTDLLVRRSVTVPDDGRQLHLAIGVVGGAQVFINGTEVTDGIVPGNEECPGRDDVHVVVPETALHRGADNLVAIRARSLPSSAYFDMQALLVPVPPNDDVANATTAAPLPFTDELSLVSASLEDGEPTDVCPSSATCTTAWYRLATAEPERLMLEALIPHEDENTPLGMAVYTGDPFGSLVTVATRPSGEWTPLLLSTQADTTYLVQVAGESRLSWAGGEAVVTIAGAPDPSVSFQSWPDSPVSTATEVQFWADVRDPAHQQVASATWDFGDGSTAEGESVQHYFRATGDLTVVLTVVMADGRRASTSQPFTVTRFEGPDPLASFTWSPQGPDNFTDVTFTSTSSDPALVGIERFDWDFGDGTTGEGENAWHRFATAGDFVVRLEIATFDGRTASTSSTITVTQRVLQDPQAAFWMSPGQPFAGQTASFYDQSWDPAYIGIASQRWDFGDGTEASGYSVQHAYATAGSYTVTLTVTTWDGRLGSTSVAVQVMPPPPPTVYLYVYPGDPSAHDTIQFNQWVWDEVGAGVASYRWDFGDGSTSVDPYPTHKFASDGAYTVSLEIVTTDGREASASISLVVATHDVAITKVTAARSASTGQTKPITADLTSRRYTESVTVQLYRGTPSGFAVVGEKQVTVKAGKSVRVTFNYRFGADDAAIGHVTFRLVASLAGYRDALPADNEALTSPTRVVK